MSVGSPHNQYGEVLGKWFGGGRTTAHARRTQQKNGAFRGDASAGGRGSDDVDFL